jgi:hypothetical protein
MLCKVEISNIRTILLVTVNVWQWKKLYDLVKGSNSTDAELENEKERQEIIIKEMEDVRRMEEVIVIEREMQRQRAVGEGMRARQDEVLGSEAELDQEEIALIEAELAELYAFMNGHP